MKNSADSVCYYLIPTHFSSGSRVLTYPGNKQRKLYTIPNAFVTHYEELTENNEQVPEITFNTTIKLDTNVFYSGMLQTRVLW